MRRQIEATLQNGLLRPGPDAAYADGDDATWIGIDWPAYLHQADVRSRGVSYVDTGGAPGRPAIVFVHGLGGIWQNWLLNIPVFMRTHRVIALDLPGFGASAMPAEKISVPGYARVVDALCDQLGIDTAVVVGSSMGGFVGAELGLDFGTRVERLVLVSAAGLSIENQRRRPLLAVARLVAATSPIYAARREQIVRRPRLRRAALQSVVRYPEKLSAQLTWELLQGQGKPGFVDALDALMSYSFRERLKEIAMPVLIVWGRNDMLVPVDDADRFERLIGANARKVVVDDTGHAPMIERPTRFNDLLQGFVEGERAPEAGVAGISA